MKFKVLDEDTYEIKEIEIVPIRKITDTEAEAEILNYITKIKRKPYISEVVEELHLDMEQVERILKIEKVYMVKQN